MIFCETVASKKSTIEKKHPRHPKMPTKVILKRKKRNRACLKAKKSHKKLITLFKLPSIRLMINKRKKEHQNQKNTLLAFIFFYASFVSFPTTSWDLRFSSEVLPAMVAIFLKFGLTSNCLTSAGTDPQRKKLLQLYFPEFLQIPKNSWNHKKLFITR